VRGLMARGVFVIGTDTGTGKTTISVALVRAFTARGRRVAVMKPCETGDGDDAARLAAATGRPLDMKLVNPYRFPLPAAPEIAARRASARIELGVLQTAYDTLVRDAQITLVEGAGGLLVPLSGGVTIADLAQRFDLPVLLVARTQLGTINHSLLSAEVARRRGLRVLGVVFSRVKRTVGPEEKETVSAIVRFGELLSFGVLPWLPAGVRADGAKLAAQAERHLAIDRLLSLIERS
jgi:dethiobiotin synthetase